VTISRQTLDLSQLDAVLAGRALGPADDGWDQARQAWNLAVDQQPAAVVTAAAAPDVQAVLRFASERGLRVAPQATGHAAAALELDHTILLRTAELGGIETDPDRRVGRVEAGVLAGDLSADAGKHGLAPLTGSSPDVSSVGFTLGGGLGWLSRRYGLACNSVRSFDVVTADGELVRTDAANEPDLFWALRGGSGSFGVVTAMEVELQPVEHVFAGFVVFDVENAQTVLRAYRDWADEARREVTSSVRFLTPPPLPDIPEPLRGRALIGITAAHLGPEAEAAADLGPLRELAEPVFDTFGTIPAAGLCRIHGDPEQPVPGLTGGLVLDEMPDEAIERLVELVGPGSGNPLLQVDFRQLGGAMAETPAGAGALSSLAGRYAVSAVGIPMDASVAQAVDESLARLIDRLAPWTARPGYLNFSERDTDPETMFPPEVYARLRSVKRTYDPQNLIRANHEIPPAGN
jgi:FAD/FMN-containing dehydrogenase